MKIELHLYFSQTYTGSVGEYNPQPGSNCSVAPIILEDI